MYCRQRKSKHAEAAGTKWIYVDGKGAVQRNSHRFWLMTDIFQILTENEENSIINDWNFPIQSMTITLQADLLLAQLVLIVLDKDDFHKRMMMRINLDIKHFKLCISKKKKNTFFLCTFSHFTSLIFYDDQHIELLVLLYMIFFFIAPGLTQTSTWPYLKWQI